MDVLDIAVVLGIGLLLGLVVGRMSMRGALIQAQLEATATRQRAERGESALSQAHEVAAVVSPLKETLGRVETQLRSLERDRVEAYASLVEQVKLSQRTSEQLRTETHALVTALRAPQARGQWGEMQLRRVVEVAGLLARCDFTEQATVRTAEGTQRPDLVVHLAGGKHVVVDAKVPLSAYLEAAEAASAPDRRGERMRAHAKQLRSHVDTLARREYWENFQPTPEFVVLFVPGEAFLAPALESDPSLLEDAMRKQVIIATPTTLLAMLRTIAYAWQQEAVTENAREVFTVGQQLYKRLSTLGGHMDKMGRSLGRAVNDYNAAVGSLETNVLRTARKLAELDVTDRPLESPTPLEAVPRPLTSPELTSAVDLNAQDEPVLRALPDR